VNLLRPTVLVLIATGGLIIISRYTVKLSASDTSLFTSDVSHQRSCPKSPKRVYIIYWRKYV